MEGYAGGSSKNAQFHRFFLIFKRWQSYIATVIFAYEPAGFHFRVGALVDNREIIGRSKSEFWADLWPSSSLKVKKLPKKTKRKPLHVPKIGPENCIRLFSSYSKRRPLESIASGGSVSRSDITMLIHRVLIGGKWPSSGNVKNAMFPIVFEIGRKRLGGTQTVVGSAEFLQY